MAVRLCKKCVAGVSRPASLPFTKLCGCRAWRGTATAIQSSFVRTGRKITGPGIDYRCSSMSNGCAKMNVAVVLNVEAPTSSAESRLRKIRPRTAIGSWGPGKRFDGLPVKHDCIPYILCPQDRQPTTRRKIPTEIRIARAEAAPKEGVGACCTQHPSPDKRAGATSIMRITKGHRQAYTMSLA